MSSIPSDDKRSGLPLALGCYAIWGLLPLYLHRVEAVPVLEFVAWRVSFTLPVCCILLLLTRRVGPMLQVMRNRATMGTLTVSAVLVGINWMTYIYAIQSNHIFAAAIGYYLNPLFNVALGTLALGERLRRAQWGAVALAGSGVAVLALAAWRSGAADTLWMSLVLATSFSLYGLIRKRVAAEALVGLSVEGFVLLPVAAAYLWFVSQHRPLGVGHDWGQSLLVSVSGLVTAVPLLLFAAAARRMDYSLMGFLQFIAPSIGVVLGLFVFHEPMERPQLVCFALIWVGIGVFCWDLWRARKVKG
ncbi:MAG: EamA family transporter RarD [Sphingomonadales bacterium]|nr:EamA family transporter RarD [Sphingomonadales bacterium]MDE2169218.1 EamA family transporter RarD [Sphingomonadales bacterium]